jgi:uncharacterized protein (TIGR02145 family)
MTHIRLSLIIVCPLLILMFGCGSKTISDIEGNKYKTVTIGTQEWMAENLSVTKYNDGTDISIVTNNDNWKSLQTPAMAWYNNDQTANKKSYGALYNWYCVNTGKLCPAGWHVPDESDWTSLTTFLEGTGTVGGKLKETGTKHWKSPNTDATNETGFNGIPGGYRSFEGTFNYLGISGYWWSSTPYNESSILFWNLRNRSGLLYRFRSEKYCGFSVRCIKDK